MMDRYPLVRIIATFSALLVGACDGASSGEEGAAVRTWRLESDPAVLLGATDSLPFEIFSRITDVALLDDGGIVVADGASGTLRVFGSGGTFERDMGGEGQGPGEFAYLGSLQALPGDTLLAYDPVAYRLTTFDRSGRLLSTSQIAPDGAAPEMYLGRDDRGRHVVTLIRPEPRDPSEVTADRMEVRRYAPDGATFVPLASFPGMRRVRSPVPFSPHPLGTVVGSTVVFADGLLPVLNVVEDAEAAPVTVGGEPGAWTLGEAWQRLAGRVESDDVRARLDEVRDGPRWDSIPRYSDMLPDPLGPIWLKRYDPGTDSHWVNRRRTGGTWTVVAPDGRPVAQVAVPVDVRLMAVGVDRVAGISYDPLGVERVVVYRLQRGKAAMEP